MVNKLKKSILLLSIKTVIRATANKVFISRGSRHQGKIVVVVCAVLTLSGCASNSKREDIPSLEPELSRVIFEKTNRVPNLIKERWFGEIVRIKNSNKDTVFSSFAADKESSVTRWLDLNPGAYEVVAQCRPHQAFKGGSSNLAIASLDVTLEAGKSLKLGCQLYKPKSKEELADKKRSVNKRQYSVKIVELDID